MQIRFRAEAEADLRAIIEHYREIAPASLDNILADIYRSIDRLHIFPHIGMQVDDRSFRRILTLRYHFKIAYEVLEDHILIIGIFRFQDRET